MSGRVGSCRPNGVVALAVTGGIAAYKSAYIASALTQQNISVHTVMTKSALEFITPLTFEALTGNEVITGMFEARQYDVRHISLADKCNLLLVVPATANIIGKFSAGIADDFLSTFFLAVNCPIILAPAMNQNMWRNKIVRENVARLQKLSVEFVLPGKGHLACGKDGEGRMAEPDKIIKKAFECLSP